MSDIHYIFEDGIAYAVHQGKVIAAGNDPDEVQRQVKQAFDDGMGQPVPPPMHGGGPTEMPPLPQDMGMSQGCEACGGEVGPDGRCINCGMGSDPQSEQYAPHEHPPGIPQPNPMQQPGSLQQPGSFSHTVVTPNGLKGTVLGKVASVWGDEVTIRLENGRIVKLPVGTELRQPKVASTTDPVAILEARLARSPDGTRESLVQRSQELESIKRYAAALIRDGVPWEATKRLDNIAVTADVEQAELYDAVAAIDDADSYAPPGFSMGVADEAAGISREDASWLDRTVDEMVAEAESQDFTKIMDEGPETLTAEMDNSALADHEVTNQIASSFILDKTAGIDRQVAEPYMTTFLARVEQCRVAELDRRTTTPIVREAAAKDPYRGLPDDVIFLS